MTEKKFNPAKLDILNNPQRLSDIPPDYIWQKLNMKKPETLVDIGAGTGFFSIPFLDYTQNGRVFACDTSDIMLQWMTDHVAPEHPGIIPVKMEETMVPLKDRCADLVFMINLHHELEAPEKILDESFRILKNKGKIFIVDWKKEASVPGPPQTLRYRPEKVQAQIDKAGFENVNIFHEMIKHFLVIGEKNN